MYFLETTKRKGFIRVFDQIVTTVMARGLKLEYIACSNPALNPSLKLMRYIFHLEQITTPANDLNYNITNVIIDNLPRLKINWLSNQYIFGTRPPRINEHLRQLKQIDIDLLKNAVNSFDHANPFSEEEIESNTYLQRYFFDDFFDYDSQLNQYKWHEKRFNFFRTSGYSCSKCNARATIKMISEIGENDSSSISYKYDQFVGQNKNKIDTAISFLNSFNLPLLALNWSFLQHPTNEEDVILQLHHTYYINDDRKAWEYNDDCFKVLCKRCHEALHEEDEIPVYDSEEDRLIGQQNENATIEPCDRCEGVGFIEKYQHVQNGICFKCWGEGYAIETV